MSKSKHQYAKCLQDNHCWLEHQKYKAFFSSYFIGHDLPKFINEYTKLAITVKAVGLSALGTGRLKSFSNALKILEVNGFVRPTSVMLSKDYCEYKCTGNHAAVAAAKIEQEQKQMTGSAELTTTLEVEIPIVAINSIPENLIDSKAEIVPCLSVPEPISLPTLAVLPAEPKPSKLKNTGFNLDIEIAEKLLQLHASATRRKKDFDLTFSYLKKLLKRKTCYYTDVTLTYHDSRLPTHATIDRVDASKGYVKGNIVVCCTHINNLKNHVLELETSPIFTSIDALEKMIKVIRKHQEQSV